MANRDTEVNNLIINELTKAEFDSAEKSETELYFVTDDKVQMSEVEGLATALNSKQNIINDLDTIRTGASKGATSIQNTNDCVHKTGDETINGVKTFNGGTGGNNVAIKAPNGIAIGGTTQTAYSQYATIRNVNNAVNTGSYYIDGNGSVLFRHKTGSSTAEGSANDAMFTINPITGIKAGWSGTAGKGITDSDLHDILIDTVNYSKLNTTAKDVLGAINELNSKPSAPNAHFLFELIWSDHIINDIQFLRADTFSWHSGNVYVTAYNTLVQEYSTGTTETEGGITFKRTTNGFKIATADMESAILNKYNTDGIAWYYILDTDNKQFKLPRTKFGFKGLRDTVGNDIYESLPNITGDLNVSIATTATGSGYNLPITKISGAFDYIETGTRPYFTSDGTSTKSDHHFGSNFDASRVSSTYQDNAPVQERGTQMYLYFYVGEYAREAIEQTAGLNTELFNNKVDKSSIYYDVDTKTLVIG